MHCLGQLEFGGALIASPARTASAIDKAVGNPAVDANDLES
jgi:hypothetical protein